MYVNYDDAAVDQAGTSASLAAATSTLQLDQSNISSHSLHTFPVEDPWVPEHLYTNGRQGRRVVCVLAQDKLHYRIYDLESASDGLLSVIMDPDDSTMT